MGRIGGNGIVDVDAEKGKKRKKENGGEKRGNSVFPIGFHFLYDYFC